MITEEQLKDKVSRFENSIANADVLLNTFVDSFHYEEDRKMAKVSVSMFSEKGVSESLKQIIGDIKKAYDHFYCDSVCTKYVKDPILTINGEEDYSVILGVSELGNNDGLVDIGIKEGLSYNKHIGTINRIGVKAKVVFIYEID